MISQIDLKKQFRYNKHTGIFTRKSTKKKAGSIDTRGYLQIRIDGRLYLAHRLVWLYAHGCFPKNHIHHKNNIRTDNRFVNLCEVTQTQNNRLSNSRKSNKTTGVHKRKDTGRYRTYININKKRVSLGSFKTKKEAVKARKVAEEKLNFYEKTRS